VREPIGFTFEHRAHLQGNFYLRDLINGYRWVNPLPIRMLNSIFNVFFELKVTNIKILKIVVEVEARKHLTYLGPRGSFLDRGFLNLFLQQSISEL
jgi:hypothetical protein